MRSGTAADSAMAKLRDLMNTSVVTASPDTTVTEAAAAMVRARTGSVIVLQGSFLAGILTERDVLRAAASGEDLTVSLVSAWMSRDPQAASPDMSGEEAAQIMLLNGFRHLPVLDGRVVCGVVSIRDLFAAKIRRPAPSTPSATPAPSGPDQG
jgi:CBS domain-containing protein